MKPAARYGCGKTRVYSVLKNKVQITASYEASLEKNATLTTRRNRKLPNSELNQLLYEWYLLALRKNFVSDGPILMEQAKAIAQRLMALKRLMCCFKNGKLAII